MRRIVDRLVPERGDVEVCAEFAVQAVQHVQIEFGRDPLAVVVRRVKDGRVLPEVDADQQRPAVPGFLAHHVEQRLRLAAREVADRRARKEDDIARGFDRMFG